MILTLQNFGHQTAACWCKRMTQKRSRYDEPIYFTGNRTRTMECCLRRAISPTSWWTLWRKPKPFVSASSIPSRDETFTWEYPRALFRKLAPFRNRSTRTRHPFCWRQLGEPIHGLCRWVGKYGLTEWKSQFTYFQQVGGLPCKPVTSEITYGLERLASYIQEVESVYDLEWADGVKYGEIFKQPEYEHSKYSFEVSDQDLLLSNFDRLKRS